MAKYSIFLASQAMTSCHSDKKLNFFKIQNGGLYHGAIQFWVFTACTNHVLRLSCLTLR